MKKYIYSLLVGLVVFFGSCSKDLETVPTDKTVPSVIFSDVESAYASINGIYRAFFVTRYSTGYAAENFGISAMNINSDTMGEDFILRDMGSQWFIYDYLYWMRTSITGTSDHPYAYWYMFYSYIDNANAILDQIDDLEGNDKDRNNIKGQALAIRAYSYLYLIQWYARTYKGFESDPGVPIYLTSSTKDTEGKPRSSTQEVYNQIVKDLDAAIECLNPSNCTSQIHTSHIDYYVACGLRARVALNMNDWAKVVEMSEKALSKTSLSLQQGDALLSGFNSVSGSEWMWGSEINEDQSTKSSDFFSHMDSRLYYTENCRKCINAWLYFQIPDTDTRKKWFDDPENWINGDEYEHPEDYAAGDFVSFNQKKFRVANPASGQGSLLYMRQAEMYLNLAEGLCMLGRYSEAREALKTLISTRDSEYEARLASIPDGNVYVYPEQSIEIDDDLNVDASYTPASLIDEIYLQRRIELWGEGFRVNDVRRQHSPIIRDYPNSNHWSPGDVEDYGLFDIEADSWETIYMLPQKEFDGNQALNQATDQNP